MRHSKQKSIAYSLSTKTNVRQMAMLMMSRDLAIIDEQCQGYHNLEIGVTILFILAVNKRKIRDIAIKFAKTDRI